MEDDNNNDINMEEIDATTTADVTAEASLALGNSYYVDENYMEAVDAYAAALLVVRPSEETIHFRALSRRSAAFFQLKRYDDALEDALEAQKRFALGGVTELQPGEGEVSHKRAGVAAFALEQWEVAKEQFSSAAQLAVLNHRDDTTFREWIQRCDDKLYPPAATPSVQKSPPKAAVSEKASPPKKSETSSVADAVTQPRASPTSSQTDSAVSRSSTSKRPAMPKYQYYQSDTVMTVAILEAGVKPEDVRVNFQPKRLTIVLSKGGVDFTVIAGTLFDQVDVERCRVQIRDEKVLIKLRKVEAHEWHELLSKKSANDDETSATTAAATASPKIIPEDEVPTVDQSKPRPYVSNRDWDKIESSLKEQEKKEIPEGDEALNKLFRDIYSKADEDTRRAMVKSYQTSGGTVLSTDWKDVAKKDYEKERTAPKDMEWKTWEGDKLPQSDD